MPINQLLESSDPSMRTRAMLLSESDLTNWLNLQFGLPLEGAAAATAIVDFSEIVGEVALHAKAKVSVTVPDYEEKHLFLLRSILGEPESSGSHQTCHWFDWGLTIEDWPFLTVEVVAESLRDITNYGDLQFTDTPELYLHKYFPQASYSQLVAWYTNGLFALDDCGEGLPLLRDVLTKEINVVRGTQQILPNDVCGLI